MNFQEYDLAVAYRICPFISQTPRPVPDSKYELSALCLRSFKAGLGTLKVKMFVILDKCPKEYEDLFSALWDEKDLVFIRCGGIGNTGTFGKQIEVLENQNDSEYVYIAEDDYVYLPGRFHLMLDLMRNNGDVDFCTPYDHPDYYHHGFHLHRMRIKVEQSQVWKTQNGTTGTFLTRQSILKKTRPVLMGLAGKNSDAGMWLSLTKEHVLNPYSLFTQPFISKFRGWSLAAAWYFNWRQLLFGKRYLLWVPVPSLATHMADGLVAPFIDWEKEFQRNRGIAAPHL